MSYFNAPVRVAVFMAAINSLVERLLRMAGKTEQVRIQVVFTGEQACVVWGYDSGKIRGTLKLPALKANSIIDRAKANRWVGYVIHEVWHVVFTSSPVWQSFCADRASPPSAMLRGLANAIEDARIERSGMELGYAEGFKIVGKDLLAHLMVSGGMSVNPNDPKQIPWAFAVGCRGYGVKGERRLLGALDPRIAVILAQAKARCAAIPAKVTPDAGTRESINIARWVLTELRKLVTADEDDPLPPPPPPPPPPRRPPKPPEGDDEGDDEGGTPGDDEGEPGEGDGESDEYDEGGDEDMPLRVGDKVECPDGTKGIITAINGDDATVAPL
jgi:hypothetical protein